MHAKKPKLRFGLQAVEKVLFVVEARRLREKVVPVAC